MLTRRLDPEMTILLELNLEQQQDREGLLWIAALKSWNRDMPPSPEPGHNFHISPDVTVFTSLL